MLIPSYDRSRHENIAIQPAHHFIRVTVTSTRCDTTPKQRSYVNRLTQPNSETKIVRKLLARDRIGFNGRFGLVSAMVPFDASMYLTIGPDTKILLYNLLIISSGLL